MKLKYLFTCLIVVFSFSGLFSQSKSDMIESAQYYFDNKEYDKAYDLYSQLLEKSPKDLDFKFRLGLCCLNYPPKKERAIELFEDIRKNEKTADAAFYLGRAYHLNYRFEEAIKEFEDFKMNNRNSSKLEKQMNEEAARYIKNCRSAVILKESTTLAAVQNLGSPVNTDAEEGVPCITADESFMVYTYKGKNSLGGKMNAQLQPDENEGDYTEDIYITFMNADSTWTEPVGIASINSKGHDAAISLSPDGRYLFLYKSDEKNSGDIYMSVLNGTTFSTPEPLNSYINTDAWEGSCSISADGQTLYFASEREGGRGGRDIWASVKINGDWGPPINLGPKINTELDDDAPFIHPDGITLFFSSQGHNSIGGYDVFYAVFKEDNFTDAVNMGMPLNTTEDDRYYVINSRGDRGYLSSNRNDAKAKGNQDIYMLKPGFAGEKPILALLKGVVYGDNQPVEATLEVTKNKDNKLIGPYFSNKLTGKYLMAITPGSTYRVKVVAEGYEPIVEDFDVEKLDKYVEIKKDFYLFKAGAPSVSVAVNTPTSSQTPTVAVTPTVAQTPTVTQTPTVAVSDPVVTNTTVNNTEVKTPEPSIPCSSPAPDVAPIKGKSLNDPAVYRQMLELAGNYCADGLIFKVQIGAYRMPQNFKYQNLREFGSADVKGYPDGITRFTQKEFKTINEAEKFRQKVMAKGQTDAWIVAFVGDKRYTLEELIMLDFLGKAIN